MWVIVRFFGEQWLAAATAYSPALRETIISSVEVK
jgi:hypothetical protein